jgi:hypothetical protein
MKGSVVRRASIGLSCASVALITSLFFFVHSLGVFATDLPFGGPLAVWGLYFLGAALALWVASYTARHAAASLPPGVSFERTSRKARSASVYLHLAGALMAVVVVDSRNGGRLGGFAGAVFALSVLLYLAACHRMVETRESLRTKNLCPMCGCEPPAGTLKTPQDQ